MFSYTTGQSIGSGLEFPQAWSEFGSVRNSFVEWLRTAYSKRFPLLFNAT